MTVEGLVIQYLASVVGVPVSAQVPPTRPARFVTLERTGGATNRFFDYPNLAVQAWGTSRADAAALAAETRDALLGMTGLPMVGRVDVGSTYNWADPDSKQARYQMTVSLVVDRAGM